MGTKVRSTAGAYAGTKYAIEALSEALRMEVAGSDVKVTCIEPGLVVTDLHRDWPVHPTKGMGIEHPLQPEDVARCVAFVLTQPAHVLIPRIMMLPSDHVIWSASRKLAAAWQPNAADVATWVPKTEELRFTGTPSGGSASAHPPHS